MNIEQSLIKVSRMRMEISRYMPRIERLRERIPEFPHVTPMAEEDRIELHQLEESVQELAQRINTLLPCADLYKWLDFNSKAYDDIAERMPINKDTKLKVVNDSGMAEGMHTTWNIIKLQEYQVSDDPSPYVPTLERDTVLMERYEYPGVIGFLFGYSYKFDTIVVCGVYR